ncbi:hypothetical protein, partial [Achromobacter sp. ACRQX]|uniref:hypothetical protein n=1 Tax=Achromobacter sp. ACRQX TaxID=2918181 RepID=UPI001EF1C3EA
ATRAADQTFRVLERRGVRDNDSGVPGAAIAAAHAGCATHAGDTAFTDNVRQRRNRRQQRHARDETRCTAVSESTWAGVPAINEYRSFYFCVTGCL